MMKAFANKIKIGGLVSIFLLLASCSGEEEISLRNPFVRPVITGYQPVNISGVLFPQVGIPNDRPSNETFSTVVFPNPFSDFASVGIFRSDNQSVGKYTIEVISARVEISGSRNNQEASAPGTPNGSVLQALPGRPVIRLSDVDTNEISAFLDPGFSGLPPGGYKVLVKIADSDVIASVNVIKLEQ